jgi:hypothetical protein
MADVQIERCEFANMDANSPPNSDPKVIFFGLFRQHWDEGTGRAAGADVRYRSWTPKEFGDAMQKCGCQISDDAVRLWYLGEHLPRSLQKAAILRVFFPTSGIGKRETAADEAFRTMDALWLEAQRRPRSQSKELLPPATYDQPAEWVIFDRRSIDGLTELRLHPPRLGNLPGTVYIDATLRIATAIYEWEERSVSIGLREAFLSVDSASYQPSKKSMIGDRSEHPYFKPTPGGADITGPRDKHGCLTGDPLGEDYVTAIEPTNDDEKPVTMRLRAGRRSFKVAVTNTEKQHHSRNSTAVNKDAVLNALIYERREKDRQGRVVLAQVRMQRKRRL